MRSITEICQHCAATPEGKPFTVADITRWHVQQGWRTIGYHAVAELGKTRCEPGRPEDEVGAHVKGHNSNSLGMCYIGGVDVVGTPKDTMTLEQFTAFEDQIYRWKEKYPTITKMTGHNQYANKACPSYDVNVKFARIIKELGLNGVNDAPLDPPSSPRVLGEGDSGNDVLGWQRDLQELDFTLADDGKFGPRTHECTIAFQIWRNLRPDGLVGRDTRQAMADILSETVA